jgi:hypothetical protein
VAADSGVNTRDNNRLELSGNLRANTAIMSRILDAARMRKMFYCVTGLVAAASAFAATTVDEEKPHGRICLALYEAGPPEKEAAFVMSAPAGPGKTVRVYVDASDKCSVLVAPMTKDGKLVNGWRPQLSEVPAEFEEILLPKSPVKWDWSTASGPFDVYVLFLQPGSKEIEEVKKLVDAMQNAKADDRILAMQSAKLKELIGRLSTDKEKPNQAPLNQPEVGGVFRGSAFPWRQFAQGVYFSADHPGVLVLSSENTQAK